MFKSIIALAILVAAGYFGYTWYTTRSASPTIAGFANSSKSISIPTEVASDKLNVLGATTSSLIGKATDLLSNATGGAAEPVINKAVSDLQDRVKSLPEEQYKKVKYEFCKDVFPSPSIQGE